MQDEVQHFLKKSDLRADMRLPFVYQLIKTCAVFTQIPSALHLMEDKALAERIDRQLLELLESA